MGLTLEVIDQELILFAVFLHHVLEFFIEGVHHLLEAAYLGVEALQLDFVGGFDVL